ncbi:hypothetical protein JCM14036_14710 [Desulfotomaculum defluvii]
MLLPMNKVSKLSQWKSGLQYDIVAYGYQVPAVEYSIPTRVIPDEVFLKHQAM